MSESVASSTSFAEKLCESGRSFAGSNTNSVASFCLSLWQFADNKNIKLTSFIMPDLKNLHYIYDVTLYFPSYMIHFDLIQEITTMFNDNCN